MVLTIKSAEAQALARELAELRGLSLTEAVTYALRAWLHVARRPAAGVETLLAEVRQVQALVGELPDRDTRPGEEILGYDDLGMPA